MKVGMRVWALLALSMGCGSAMAVLSIEGTVLIEPPPATLLRGDVATLTYTMTNTGDEPLDFATSGTGYWQEGAGSTVYPLPNAGTLPCLAQFVDFSGPPGQSAFVVNTNLLFPWPIPPGESRLCVMELAVSMEAAGPFTQRFGFTGTRGTQRVNVGQDVVFNLGQGAVAVPVFGWPAQLLLVFLIPLLGAKSLRR